MVLQNLTSQFKKILITVDHSNQPQKLPAIFELRKLEDITIYKFLGFSKSKNVYVVVKPKKNQLAKKKVNFCLTVSLEQINRFGRSW